MKSAPRPGQILCVASGVVMLLFSFLPFYSEDAGFGSHFTVSAWGKGLFPLATFLPLFGLIVAVSVALGFLADLKLPEIVGFSQDQLQFVLAFTAGVIVIGFLLASGPGKGIGYYFEFLGTGGLVVGTVLELLKVKLPAGMASAATPGAAPAAFAPPPDPAAGGFAPPAAPAPAAPVPGGFTAPPAAPTPAPAPTPPAAPPTQAFPPVTQAPPPAPPAPGFGAPPAFGPNPNDPPA